MEAEPQQQPEALTAVQAAAEQHGMQLDTLANKAIAAGDIEQLDLSHLGDDAQVQFRGQLHAAAAMYQKQADDYVSSLGVDPQDLWTWARANRSQELHEAMRQHYFAQNPKAYELLANVYLTRVAPDVATMRTGGLDAHSTRNGDAMVSIGGLTMTAKAAARAGLI
jgi:hypothetical protein